MRTEVSSAVDFISNLLRNNDLTPMQLQTFRNTLVMLLCSHYEDHWFPEKPCKGSGYRCIRINHKIDPIVARAGSTIGVSENQLFDMLPNELTLWVDPDEVSYRIGEEGSIGILYEIDRSSTSSGSDSESSRTPSPVHVQHRSLTQSPTGSYHSGTSSPVPFIQTCKEQLRYFLPEMDANTNAVHYSDFLSGFVAS